MDALVMKWLLLTVVAATLAATAEATVMPGCCSEGKWQAKYWVSSKSTTPSSVYLNMIHRDFRYDAPNQRTVELVTTNAAKKPVKFINFYKTGVGYTYDANTGVCAKNVLGTNFPKLCTPANFQVVDRNVLTKVGKRWVNATRLQFHSHVSGYETVETQLVKNDDCITLTRIHTKLGFSGTTMNSQIIVELNDDLWCEEDFKIPEACIGKAWNSGRETETQIPKDILVSRGLQ